MPYSQVRWDLHAKACAKACTEAVPHDFCEGANMSGLNQAGLARLLLLLLLTVPAAGCAVAGGIFKAGFVTAIVVIILVVALVAFLGRGRG